MRTPRISRIESKESVRDIDIYYSREGVIKSVKGKLSEVMQMDNQAEKIDGLVDIIKDLVVLIERSR